MRLLTVALAGLEFAEEKGEVEVAVLVLFCLGFLASRFPRCCFWAMSGLLLFVRLDPRRFGQPCTICHAAVTRSGR